MAVRYICDKCGRTIRENKGVNLGGDATATQIIVRYMRPYYDAFSQHKEIGTLNKHFDLCDDCLEQIVASITDNINIEFDPANCKNDERVFDE